MTGTLGALSPDSGSIARGRRGDTITVALHAIQRGVQDPGALTARFNLPQAPGVLERRKDAVPH